MTSNETIEAARYVMGRLFDAFPAGVPAHRITRDAPEDVTPSLMDAYDLIDDREWAYSSFHECEAAHGRTEFVHTRFEELTDALRVVVPDAALLKYLIDRLGDLELYAVEEMANPTPPEPGVDWEVLKAELDRPGTHDGHTYSARGLAQD